MFKKHWKNVAGAAFVAVFVTLGPAALAQPIPKSPELQQLQAKWKQEEGKIVEILVRNLRATDAPPVGLKISYQPWTPVEDDDSPVVYLDNDDLLSRLIHGAYVNQLDNLTAALKDTLGEADLVAPGMGFRDIDLSLPEPVVTFEQFEGDGTKASPFRASFRVDLNNWVFDARLTTPDIPVIEVGVDGALDPHCRVTISAAARVVVNITNDLKKPFSSPNAADVTLPPDLRPKPQDALWIKNVQIAGRNLTCGIPIAVLNGARSVDFLRVLIDRAIAKEYDKKMSQVNANLSVRMGDIVAKLNGMTDGALAGVQDAIDKQLLKAQGVLDQQQRNALKAWSADMLDNFTVQGWRVENGRALKLVLNLAPASPMPEAPFKLGFAGPFTPGPGFGGLSGPPECGAIKVKSARKTGPRRMVSPGGGLGPEPLEYQSVSVLCQPAPLADRQVFGVLGLSPVFPNQVDFQIVGNCRGGRYLDKGVQAEIEKPAGLWTTSARFLAADLLKPVAMRAQNVATPCGAAASKFDVRRHPRLRFDDRIRWPGDAVAINPQPLPPRIARPDRVFQPGGDVAINPQPLPPRELEIQTRTTQPDRRGTCQAYADEAVAQAAKGVQECGFSGPRYALYTEDHLNWCMTAPDAFVDGERQARQREIAACGVCRTYTANTLAQFEKVNACATPVGVSGVWIPNSPNAHMGFCLISASNGERVVNSDTAMHTAARDDDLSRCMQPGLR